MIVDWKKIATAWQEAVIDAISVTVKSNASERFYAGAFWLLYGDYSSLHAPVFGLNAESTDPEVRWHPPDWRWSIIDQAHERVQALYEPLLALDVDETQFETLWDEHIDVLAEVSRRVTESVRSGRLPLERTAFSPTFFVGIIDFAQGDDAFDYLRMSVDEPNLTASGIFDAMR